MVDPEGVEVSVPLPEVPEPDEPVAAAVGPTVVVPSSGGDTALALELGRLAGRVDALEARISQPEPALVEPEELFEELPEEIEESVESALDDALDEAVLEAPEELPDFDLDEVEMVAEGMPSELREAAAATAGEVEGEVPGPSLPSVEPTAPLIEGSLPEGPARRDHWAAGSFPFRR